MPLCGPIGEVFERDYHWRAWPLLESMELLTPAVDHPATLYSHGCSGGGVLALGVHSSLALRRARDTPIATTSVLNAILTPTLASVLAPACALALAPILAPAFTQETAEAVAIAASALAVPEPELVRSSSMPISNSSILPSHGHAVIFETGCFVVTLVCTLVIIFAGLSIKHTSLAGKALCRLPFFQMVTVTAMMSGGAEPGPSSLISQAAGSFVALCGVATFASGSRGQLILERCMSVVKTCLESQDEPASGSGGGQSLRIFKWWGNSCHYHTLLESVIFPVVEFGDEAFTGSVFGEALIVFYYASKVKSKDLVSRQFRS